MTAAIPSQHIAIDACVPFEILKSKNVFTDCVGPISPVDVTDNPLFSKSDATDKNIFKHMKSEYNRLISFQNKWPVREISPESLAAAGFFYLQQEDIVQCPFCEIKIFDWIHRDKPLREHMRRSPKCHFLMGCDIGNIPLVSERNQDMHSNFGRKCMPEAISVSYKPKHPRMADLKRRILTFSNWPLNQPTPQQLAECGLYYSGVHDVVTCFFCGGALGNWEPNDDPWDEHVKFFPDCAFLAVAKTKKTHPTKVLSGRKQNLVPAMSSTNDILSDIIEQAQDIFPENLVLEAVKRKGGSILSLQELCDDILEIKQKQNAKSTEINGKESTAIPHNSEYKGVPDDMVSKVSNGSFDNDVLICKVCMDRERSAVFQPCGHFVSCWNCASLVSNCPVCRRPVTHKIRTYIS